MVVLRSFALMMTFFLVNNIGQAQAKNVLLIYSDDHSYHALGAAGNKEVKTPNIDKLAKEGMIFLQAHVMGGHQGAVCVPSRIMLLTGRYVNRLPQDGAVVPDSIVSLPEVLRSRGYTTYHTGKWHSDKASHHRMFNAGGDIFFGGMHFDKDGGQQHPTVYTFDSTGQYSSSLKRNADTFSTALYANNAVNFLNSKTAKERPFFCYVAFTSPHDPRTPPTEFEKMYPTSLVKLPPNYLPEHPFDNGDMKVRDEQLLPWPRTKDAVKREIALYYGMISEMDNEVGRIMKALEENGLRENTIVIFAGDNGLAVGQHGLLGKQNLYEHSIRVPMVVSGPGIHKASRYAGFNYLSDVAPTLYDYLGIPAPATVEGKSFKRVFTDSNITVRPHLYNVYGHWSRSIKTNDGFKLILYNVEGVARTQLFNLKKDPWEQHDLSTDPAFAGKVKVLRQLLKEEMAATHDNLDIDLPDWGRTPSQKGRGS